MPKASSCFCFSFFGSKKTAKKNNVQQDSRPAPLAPSPNQAENKNKNKTIKIISNVKNEEIQVSPILFNIFLTLNHFFKNSIKILWNLMMIESLINISVQYVSGILTVKLLKKYIN